jgi:hypothetical protein
VAGNDQSKFNRRSFLVSSATAATGSLTGCVEQILGGNSSDQAEPTPERTPTETTISTDTKTPTVTETDSPAELGFELLDEPVLIPEVTEENQDRTIGFSAEARDPDGIQNLEITHEGDYSDEEKVAEAQQDIEGEIEATRLQPGTNTFRIKVTDQNGNQYIDETTEEAPNAPFLADLHGNTERAWDDVPRDLDFMEFYMNDIAEAEGTLKATGNYGAGWDGIEKYIFRNIEDYSDHHWVQRGVKLVSDALSEEADFEGSGGFVNAQVPGVKKFMPEITEQPEVLDNKKENILHPAEEGSYDDKFLEWEATATSDNAITHEQGMFYDWEEEELWVHEPHIREFEDMNTHVRKFHNSKYSNKDDIQHSIGLDYEKLRQQVKNGRIDREEPQWNIRGSLTSIIDSSENDVSQDYMFEGPAFTDRFGEALTQNLHDLNNEKMESLIEIAESIYSIYDQSDENENIIIDTNKSVKDFNIYRNVSQEQRDQVIKGNYQDLHQDVLNYQEGETISSYS